MVKQPDFGEQMKSHLEWRQVDNQTNRSTQDSKKGKKVYSDLQSDEMKENEL